MYCYRKWLIQIGFRLIMKNHNLIDLYQFRMSSPAIGYYNEFVRIKKCLVE